MRLLFQLLGLALALPCQGGVPEFFEALFVKCEPDYRVIEGSEYQQFCLSAGLDSADSSNINTFLKISFVHDLLTGNGAVDCVRGGLLDIPYFWHWTDPNPRHAIILLPDSVELGSISPAYPHSRYRTYGDIDRVPAVFFGDLFSESPKYYHPDCGAFYTFGWCSEREMAFLSLMTCLGFDGKIVQVGIHSWSALWCRFRTESGDTSDIALMADNTFDRLWWEPIPRGQLLSDWSGDLGEGLSVEWYDDVAKSENQLLALVSLPISPIAAKRIEDQVLEALRSIKGPGR